MLVTNTHSVMYPALFNAHGACNQGGQKVRRQILLKCTDYCLHSMMMTSACQLYTNLVINKGPSQIENTYVFKFLSVIDETDGAIMFWLWVYRVFGVGMVEEYEEVTERTHRSHPNSRLHSDDMGLLLSLQDDFIFSALVLRAATNLDSLVLFNALCFIIL